MEKEETPVSGISFINRHKDDQAPKIDLRVMRSKPWISFGKKNLFPQDLVELADNSAIQQSLLQATATLIAGEGLIFDKGKEESGKKALREILKNTSIKEFLWKTASDIAYFDGYYLNVIWNKGAQIDKIKHIDFSKTRASKVLEDDKPTSFWISNDWTIATKRFSFNEETEHARPFNVPAFDVDTFRKSRANGQLLQVRRYKPTKLFYSEPAYMGALNYIEISARIGDFHNNNLKNGMMGNMHIHLFEDLSDSEKLQRVESKITEKFAGSEKGGRIVLTWSRNADGVPKLEPIQTNDSHEMFTALNKKVNEEIVSAHRFQPILAGLADVPTGLGGKGLALKESIEILQNMVIKPKQMMIEDTLETLLRINGVDTEVKIKPLTVASFLADTAVLLKTLTIDEIRENILGLGPMTSGGDEFAQTGRITN